jgi:nucleotide-binding universal stress UspA family protein
MSNSKEPRFNAVVGFDFSPLGDRAVQDALSWCSRHPGAELHAIVVGWADGDSVALPTQPAPALPQEQADELARRHIAELVQDVQKKHGTLGLERVAVYATVGDPAERIIALADSLDADLIVVGTHGRKGLSRWVMGSVAEQVMRRASCGVWVIRPRDFLDGSKLPSIDPPLKPGEHALKPFNHRPTYHYVHRMSQPPSRMMPAS